MKSLTGFSLIEILITLAIIGILFAIAIPNYQRYRVKAERMAAEASLVKLAAVLEQYYTLHNTYQNISFDDLKINHPKHYLLKLIAANDSDFTIAAEPQSESPSKCGTLILHSNGKKETTGSGCD